MTCDQYGPYTWTPGPHGHYVILRDGVIVAELSLYGLPFPSDIARQFCALLADSETEEAA